MTAARVLVVDDEESVLVTIAAVLRMDGYEVETATSAADAVARVRSGDHDVVLTDLRLGDASGQEVLAVVRRERPQAVAIILTGYASLESSIAALREGAYDYLVKPSEPDELRATVRRAVERRQLMRRLVELQELDELKSQFLSIASHELRTPITAVSGFAELALRTVRARLERAAGAEPDADLDRLARQLAIIQDRSAKLGRLVRELLDVSRIQSGRLEFDLAPVDLAELAGVVVEQHEMTSPARRYEVIADGPTVVVGDRDHLEQVIANLVDNAVKYSPEGSTVRIRLSSAGGEARLAVEDQGIGVSPDQLARIFDLFVRSSEAEARRTPGLGLGLYIARGIVERHRGRIWAESAPGSGTRVHVALPCAPLPAAGAPTGVGTEAVAADRS